MIKAVVFDWGGVIAPNNEGGWVSSYAQLLGLSFKDALSIWKQSYRGLNTGAINEDIFWERTEKLCGHSLPDTKHDIWMKGLAQHVWPEMIKYVEQLQSRGYKTALLSNTVAAMFPNKLLENHYKKFEPVILSHEIGLAKPSSEVFYRLLNQMNLEPNECVFVDDLPKNIDAAKELGFYTVIAVDAPSKTIDLTESILASYGQ